MLAMAGQAARCVDATNRAAHGLFPWRGGSYPDAV